MPTVYGIQITKFSSAYIIHPRRWCTKMLFLSTVLRFHSFVNRWQTIYIDRCVLRANKMRTERDETLIKTQNERHNVIQLYRWSTWYVVWCIMWTLLKEKGMYWDGMDMVLEMIHWAPAPYTQASYQAILDSTKTQMSMQKARSRCRTAIQKGGSNFNQGKGNGERGFLLKVVMSEG